MPIAVNSWEELCAAFDTLHHAITHLKAHGIQEDDLLAREKLIAAGFAVILEMESVLNAAFNGGN